MPVTSDQVRRLALAMPESEEASHHGHPDFRVRGKIFATLQPDGRHAVVKLTPDQALDLLLADPDTYVENAWSKHGWTTVVLDRIQPAQMQELLETAWANTAPKRLVAKWNDSRK